MKALPGFAAAGAVLAAVLLLHGAGHASSPFAVAVARAATKCPDGFSSVGAHALPADSQPTATLSSSCALEFGIPAGDKGDKGDTGVQGVAGPPGLSGYTTASASSVANGKIIINSNNGMRTEATAVCPAGEKAVGGGYSISTLVNGVPATQTAAVRAVKLNSSKSNIYKNGPTSDGTGWTVGAVTAVIPTTRSNTFRARVTLKVTANCAKVVT
jgi:hypothetical protein